MTDTRYYQNHGEYDLYVYGHADYNVAGNDIVCAAISILTYTLDTMLEKEKIAPVHRVMNDGEYHIILSITRENDRISTIFETFLCGMELLHENYSLWVGEIMKKVVL